MKISVHAVGRMKAGPERELAARYFDRLSRGAASLGLDWAGVTEIGESRARSAEERRREESDRLRAIAANGAALFILDETGRQATSAEFAALIARTRDGGAREACFAIGGPDGHDPGLRGTARGAISFGAQTWPHQLVRVMLAEQLYRATTILSGHPYHRA